MDSSCSSTSHAQIQGSNSRATIGLWGHLLSKHGASRALPSSTASGSFIGKAHIPAVAPLDKAATSTRILLHDTQANLEKFTERVDRLTEGIDAAKKELVTVQKLYQDEHEQLVGRIIELVNRCQTEVQKTIGSPAQESLVHGVSMDLAALATRVEGLDKKVDVLTLASHTQAQSLQSIQDQQAQILTALLPILPLLQSVPLHIDMARNAVKDSVLELKQHMSPNHVSRAMRPSGHVHSRSLSQSPGTRHPRGGTPTPPTPKKRRLDETRSSSRPCTPAGSAQPSNPPMAVSHCASRLSRNIQPVETPLPEIASSNLAEMSGAHTSIENTISPTMLLKTPLSPQRTTMATWRPSTSRPVRSPSRTVSTRPPVRALRVPATPVKDRSSLRPASALPLPPPAAPQRASVSTQPHTTSLLHLATQDPVGITNLMATPLDTPASLLGSVSSREGQQPLSQFQDTAQEKDSLVLEEQSRTPYPGSRGDMRLPGNTPSNVGIGKPMSLKDRRALRPEASVRNEGKRFIPLDDDDDDDDVDEG